MGTKATPNQVKYNDMLIMLEKSAALRVQNLGVSVDFDWEKIRQIGSDTVLDYDGDLGTSVTMDSNSWGTIDLLAQLTSRQLATTPVVNSCAAQGGAVGIADDAANTITMKTFRDAKLRRADMVIPIREGTLFERSVYIPNQLIAGFEYSYSVDGLASENYTLSGRGEYLMGGGKYKDLRVARATYATANTCDLDDSSIVIDLVVPKHVIVGVNVNGEMYFKGPDLYAFAYATGTLTVTYEDGGAAADIFASGDRITLIYVSLAAAVDVRDTWAKVIEASHPVANSPLDVDVPGLAAVDRGMVEIYYYNRNYPTANDLSGNASAPSLMLRCQQAGFSGDLGGEDLFQLSQFNAFARDFEDNVTVNLTVLDSDMATLAALAGRTSAEIASYKDDVVDLFNSAWNPTDPLEAGFIKMGDFFQTISGNRLDNAVIVKIYKDRTKQTLLKTITVTAMELTGHDPIATQVNGRNALTFQFTANDISIVGSAASPF